MTRLACIALGLLIVAAHPVRVPASTPDALASLKLALGGEDALASVRSVHTSGTLKADGLPESGKLDQYFEFPDKFLRVSNLPQFPPQGSYSFMGMTALPSSDPTVQPPAGARDASFDIRWKEMRVGFLGPRPIMEGSTETLADVRRSYCAFALPLFGATTSEAYRTEPTSYPDVVRFGASSGLTWTLDLDTTTHLPAKLAWSQTIRGGTREWTTTFSDFKKVGALTWPHKMITRLGKDKINEVQIKKYEFNRPFPK